MKTLKISRPPCEELPDRQVVNNILNGNKEWFEVLIRRYNQSLYRAIRSYLKEDSDVEDAMQDVYLKAFQKLDQFHGDSAFATWLIRIGINEALQCLRKKKKEERLIESNFDKNIFNLSPVHDMNPENKAIQAEVRLMLEAAIDALPLIYRTVYILKEVEGMENPAIAIALELSESNVKVRIHRAKKLLKEQLLKMSSSIEVFEFGNKRCDRMVEWVMGRI